MNSQNGITYESDELTTDLISAIKEFEETSIQIASKHQTTQEIRTSLDESSIVSRTEEKGPIEYFNKTKESLRHVMHTEHDLSHNEPKSIMPEIANDTDENETAEGYVKIPVQQLINTFEKQMRSIIKQKINENIQWTTDSNKTSATCINKDNIEIENVTNPNEQFTVPIENSFAESTAAIQQFNRIEQHQLSHSIDELRSETSANSNFVQHSAIDQSTRLETTSNQFNSNGTHQNDHGGKA